MDNKELNEKLARWAGFEQGTHITNRYYGTHQWYIGDKFWKRPDGFQCTLPNFTSSLNACFKWLVPNLEASGSASVFMGIEFNVGNEGEEAWQCILFAKNGGNYTEGYAETPALALCLAIERLIEAENEQ